MRREVAKPVFGVLFALMLVLGIHGVARGQSVERELPADFKSDKCSLFFDGNWGHCCVEHDKTYFFGGTKAERKAADRKLYECIKATGGCGKKAIAGMMYVGVRIGGVGFLKLPFSWGFGKRWKSKPEADKPPNK